VPAALIGLGVVYLLYRAQDSAARAVAAATQEKIVDVGAQRFTALLVTVAADIRFLAEQQALQRLLDDNTEAARQEVAADHLTMLKHRRIYEQIRLIDEAGSEVIQVDWSGGAPGIAPEEELEGQADRYVADAMALDPGEIYVSPLDPVTERGAIVQPINPVIRFAVPVVDRDGRRRGLIVATYRAQRLLDRVRELALASREQLWLLNSEGYWLLGPRPEDEWAFMYPDREDRAFARQYPEVWEAMRDTRTSGQIEVDEGVFTYARLSLADPSSEAADDLQNSASAPFWILLTYASPEGEGPGQWNLGLATSALMLLIVGGSGLIARHWTRRELSEQSVRSSEARFRSLLESAPDAVVITDAKGRVVLANAQTLQLFGYEREELVGQSVEVLVPERYRGGHVGYRMAYAAAPRARPMGAGLELYGQRRDGTEFPVAISLSPSETDQGKLIFCDIRDVTAQRETERRIQEMNDRLSRDNADLDLLNKELEAFSYSVSHDLRAPLRAIDGFSQALVEDCADQLDDAGRGYLGRIRTAAQRMALLIDDLLKLARVTRAEVSFDDVDLGDLVEDVTRDLRSSYPERKVEVQVEKGLNVHADARLLRIALENLLGNAWKFTSGRDIARIEVGETSRKGRPAYFVRDNGVGFDMAHAGRLFGAFQRLHHESEFAGTGIGLATVQRIIRRHGGHIWVEAEAGKGATFYFTIRKKEAA
jgi:PAS domain S-box-containing protein